MRADYEGERAFQRKTPVESVTFVDLWPSATRGDGKVVANNRRTGGRQGKSNLIRKAHCRQCGYPTDLSMNDSSGGSLDGNGACYVSSVGVATTYPSGGGTHTENYGQPANRMGAGCPLCGSKNSSKDRGITTAAQIYNNPRQIGF